ncbi:ParB N-terminal domain-containing protein [Deinococcus sp. NW-56]|uniref:ParB N-terminal domain-containing protein n=1 Tax=Deinococcus sp. NW-56 TaxID=2080419 RepID=UPI00131A413B|nr:ParB N-terminal domain-containing protein [Deinococcus sp. NW-56]
MTRALSPDVQAVLREATISEDGLTLTLAGDLDRKLYQATAKAIEALGGKWNRKAQAHLFTSDVRQILAGVLDGDKLPKKNPLAFFETPEPLVELMLSFLGDVRGVRVLEPSAGDGAIADALLDAGAEVDVIELDDTRHAHLVGAGYQPVARDFLAFTPTEPYPVIVMNPPFTAEGDAQAYITHIEHAWTNCLAPGGTLVAIAPSGFTFRQDKRAQTFRTLVEDHGEHTPNAENAFVESGTGVQTVTLCVRKPAPAQEVAMPVPTEQPVAGEAPSLEGQAPRLTPGILGLLLVPLSQTVRSACNVRNHYDPQAVEELAASLAAEGQIENCTGRWNAEGQVEIVAGETRRRAQLLRVERGEIPADYPLMVHVREMTDAEALGVSATENMRRRSMTPLEECEAMQRLNEAGRSIEEIQAMFGYKSAQPVADRILVARNLHTTPRELLDRGELSLAAAMVIARAPGQDLQLSMTSSATGYMKTSATGLAQMLTRGEFLAKHARFDVEKSGLEVRKDLFDTFEAYFADKAMALNLQIEWMKAKAEKLRAKGKHEFVHVITDGQFERYGRGPYTGWADDGKGGLVFVLNPHTGEVRQEDRVQLRASATDGGEKPQKVRETADSAYQEAHELRARALRESVLGNTHLTLALTVWGLILGGQPGSGRVKLAELNGLPEKAKRAELMPELHVRSARLGEVLAPIETRSQAYHAVLYGKVPDVHALLRLLIDTPDETLLDYLNTLVSVTAYDWSVYDNKRPASAEYALLASLTDAPQRLAASFRLTDEWLKRYPKHELLALADEAGLGRALIEDCGTLKEMRARLLEHADRLHTEGFVPALVRFPEPPATPDATATAAD